LKASFAANPCFEIARMFADSSGSSAEDIYGTLARIVYPSKYPSLFLALAAYLNLNDKIQEIKDSKLIAVDSK
jgi:hypothetical protein